MVKKEETVRVGIVALKGYLNCARKTGSYQTAKN
jgi:hypothetical protein